MKTSKIIISTAILFLGFVSTVHSQDYAMVKAPTLALNIYNHTSADVDVDYSQNSILNHNTYTYEYKGEEVIVVFNNDEHIEYYNDKQYYIKSQLTWINKDECLITIIESTVPGVPFNAGTELAMKVIKTKGDYVYYESTLAGTTWDGKMKLSNYNNHF
jgi:hypothetical protein